MFHFSVLKVGQDFIVQHEVRIGENKRTGGQFSPGPILANGGKTVIMGAQLLGPGNRILIWPLPVFFWNYHFWSALFLLLISRTDFCRSHLRRYQILRFGASFKSNRFERSGFWFFLHRPIFFGRNPFFRRRVSENTNWARNSNFPAIFSWEEAFPSPTICRLFQEAKGFLLCFSAYQSTTISRSCAVFGKILFFFFVIDGFPSTS